MSVPAPRRITLEEAVDIVGSPPPAVATKIRPQLDDDHLTFIANSPLLFLATSDATGELDCSPRGDPPGFVRVLDDHLLAIPDRPGNRLAQSMRNIAEHPGVGLLFAIPGVQETLRVNGRAYLTDEPGLLEAMAVDGRRPKLAIVVEATEVYIHCGRALLRAHAWEIDSHPAPGRIPSIGSFVAHAAAANTGAHDISAAELDVAVAAAYRELY